MLRELDEHGTDDNTRYNLHQALARGPWCWPPEGHCALERARWATGCDAAPVAGRSDVLAVTEHHGAGSLWVLAAAGVPGATLGSDAVASWEDAICALPRSLPVLWTCVGRHQAPPSFVRLASHARSGPALPERVIAGPSAGLAFFLLLASRVLEIRCPADLVASATIDPWGGLGPVDGLRAKIEAIVAVAPRVRRLAVAEVQADEARRLAGERLEVVGLKSAAEAARRLLPNLAEHLVQESDPARRHALVRSFFRLALGGRRELLEWEPVETAARLAREHWVDLPGDDRYCLEFSAAVAARHHGNRGRLSLPSSGWLNSLSTPLRITVLAHLVQHSADTGDPAAEDVLALAGRDLPQDAKHGFDRQLRLHGAVARLDAIRGQAARALAAQRELACTHFRNLDHEEVSLPLCEWLRLAGATGQAAALEEAKAFLAEADRLGVFGRADRPFLLLAEARAEVQAGAPSARTLSRLDSLSQDGTAAAHVRLSAIRWAGSCAGALGDAGAVSQAEARLRRGPAAASQAQRTYAALWELDRALDAGEGSRAAEALAVLRELQPGVMAHLAAGCAPESLAEHVARFFPY